MKPSLVAFHLRQVCATALLLSMVGGMVACTEAFRPSIGSGTQQVAQEGGHDGGGGNVHLVSAEEVREAIKESLGLLTESDLRQNILVGFLLQWIQEDNFLSENEGVAFKFDPRRVFPSLSVEENKLEIVTEADRRKFESPVLKALKTSKIKIQDSGPCSVKDNAHAEASVSSKSLDAELCFSLSGLQRRTKYDLLREVLALTVHELVHMAGGDEDEANKWQREFSQYYVSRFGSHDVRNLKQRIASTMLAGVYINLGGDNGSDEVVARHLTANLTMAAMYFSNIPSFLDALLLRVAFRPKEKELVAMFSNSVLALLHIARRGLSEREGRQPTVAELRETQAELQNLSMMVLMNFKVLTGEPGPPVCILPAGSPGRLYTWSQNTLGRLDFEPEMPPRVCTPGSLSPEEVKSHLQFRGNLPPAPPIESDLHQE